jgi:hypothetical protein
VKINKDKKTLIFLDIDGVVNSHPAPKNHLIRRLGLSDYRFQQVAGFPIWTNPDVISALNSWNRIPEVQIVWLTTWDDRANRDFAPAVGLPQFSTLASIMDSSNYSSMNLNWWKYVQLQKFMSENSHVNKIVWLDDDLRRKTKNDLGSWFRGLSLLITPNSCPGLIPEHLHQIEKFLQ